MNAQRLWEATREPGGKCWIDLSFDERRRIEDLLTFFGRHVLARANVATGYCFAFSLESLLATEEQKQEEEPAETETKPVPAPDPTSG